MGELDTDLRVIGDVELCRNKGPATGDVAVDDLLQCLERRNVDVQDGAMAALRELPFCGGVDRTTTLCDLADLRLPAAPNVGRVPVELDSDE